MPGIHIFKYFDYRNFLGDWYKQEKRRNPKFSYQVLANKAGFKAKDFIYRVIQGQSRISEKSVEKLLNVIPLKKREREYFKCLVSFNQARKHEDRERHYEHICSRFKPELSRLKEVVIPYDHYELYGEWYHTAVRSLINSHEFKGDYDWLAAMTWPPISPSQARNSVQLLLKLKLVAMDHSGVYRLTDQAITTGDTVKKGALHKYYRKGMELMSEAMDDLPLSQRNISGVTVGLSKSGYDKIVEKIAALRREIALLAQEEEETDRVYQVNFHLFPMSNVKKLNKRDSGKRAL